MPHWQEPGDPGTAAEADLQAIRNAHESLAHDLARNDPKEMEEAAAALLRKHSLPEHMLRPLALGLVEAAIRAWDTAERRTLGTEPLIFTEESTPSPEAAACEREPDGERLSSGDQPVPKPVASTLIEPHFAKRAKTAGISGHTINQERTTLRMFLEVAGDLPVDTYDRGHISSFLDTMRRMPATYGRSPKDKNRTVADLIAEADEKQASSATTAPSFRACRSGRGTLWVTRG